MKPADRAADQNDRRYRNALRAGLFEKTKNRLVEILPSRASYADLVKVVDTKDLSHTYSLHANALAQKVRCYRQKAV